MGSAAARKLRAFTARRRERATRRAVGRASGEVRFITGNGLAARCRHVLNYEGPTLNSVENDWWFCKTDHLELFFADLAPEGELVLFTHNSDQAIGERHRALLERPNLVAWFAANAALPPPNLHASPRGGATPSGPQGDIEELRGARALPPEKPRLFDTSFSLRTNPDERGRC